MNKLITILIIFISFSCTTKEIISNNMKLSSITKTNRISSNHYSEVVTDKFGNSYLASFKKKDDNRDYIYICKVDKLGNIVWEKGLEFQGRATAITLTNRNSIAVTGYAAKELKFNNYSIDNNDKNKVFIAEFDFNGNCIKLLKLNGDGIFNIESNSNNDILITGISNSDLNIEGNLWTKRTKKMAFLLLLDSSFDVSKIYWTDAQIWQIKSFNNNFYLTGSFSEKFILGSDTLITLNSYDEDGLLIKIDDKGEISWSKQFGHSKNINQWEKSKESGNGIAFDSLGNIFVCSSLNSDTLNENNSLYLIKYNDSGNQLSTNKLEDNISNTLCTIQIDLAGNYWITGNKFTPKSSQSFIYKFSNELDLLKKYEPKHSKNMLFRSSYITESNIIYTGHFQEFISIENTTLNNDGEHELFHLKIPLD